MAEKRHCIPHTPPRWNQHPFRISSVHQNTPSKREVAPDTQRCSNNVKEFRQRPLMSIEEDRRVEFSKRVHSGDSNSAWPPPPPPPPPRARKKATAAVRDDKESDKGEREKRCKPLL
jgi:hypothetical protein